MRASHMALVSSQVRKRYLVESCSAGGAHLYLMCRVGQKHIYTVFLAGKSTNIRSYTVYIYGSGQFYLSVVVPTNVSLGSWVFDVVLPTTVFRVYYADVCTVYG